MSGGQMMWKSPYSASLEHVDETTKLANVFYQIKKQKELIFLLTFFVVKI